MLRCILLHVLSLPALSLPISAATSAPATTTWVDGGSFDTANGKLRTTTVAPLGILDAPVLSPAPVLSSELFAILAGKRGHVDRHSPALKKAMPVALKAHHAATHAAAIAASDDDDGGSGVGGATGGMGGGGDSSTAGLGGYNCFQNHASTDCSDSGVGPYYCERNEVCDPKESIGDPTGDKNVDCNPTPASIDTVRATRMICKCCKEPAPPYHAKGAKG